MRGQQEPVQDFGIGKKVEPEIVEKDPWVKGNTPGTYRNTETGKTETRIPANEGANQQTMAEVWKEYLRRKTDFVIFLR